MDEIERFVGLSWMNEAQDKQDWEKTERDLCS